MTTSGSLTLNDNGTATPYPSEVEITTSDTTVAQVKVTLNGLTAQYPDDLDILLVGPGANPKSVILMSDAGGQLAVSGINITFADGAPALPNDGQLQSGTYKPTDWDVFENGQGDPGLDAWPSTPAGMQNPTLLLSTFNNSDPKGKWGLYVVDDTQFGAKGSISSWTVSVWTTPTIKVVTENNATDKRIKADEDTPANANVEVGSASTALSSIAVVATSSNQDIVKNENIKSTGTGALRTITVTPNANASGDVTITVKAKDTVTAGDPENPFSLSAPKDIYFTFTAKDDAPQFVSLSESSIAATQGGGGGSVGSTTNVLLTFIDGDAPAANTFTYTVTSSDPTIVAPSGVFFTPTAKDLKDGKTTSYTNSFYVAPVGARTGTVGLTIEIKDGQNLTATTSSLSVTINANSTNIILANATSVAVPATPAEQTSTITVAADSANAKKQVGNVRVILANGNLPDPANTSVKLLSPTGVEVPLMAGAGGNSLVKDARIAFDSEDNNGAMPSPMFAADALVFTNVFSPSSSLGTINNQFIPMAGDWKLKVNGPAGTELKAGWLLNLHPAPEFSPISKVVVDEDAAAQTINFTVASVGSTFNENAITPAVSTAAPLPGTPPANNSTLVTVTDVKLAKDTSSASGSVKLNFTANANGTCFVTLTTTDKAGDSGRITFEVEVKSVNDLPVISIIPRQSGPAGLPIPTTAGVGIPFTVSDTETAPNSLVVKATSSNVKTFPPTNPDGTSGAIWVKQMAPGSYQLFLYPTATVGTTVVTVSATDGNGGTSFQSFDVILTLPFAPTFANASPIQLTKAPAAAAESSVTVAGLQGTIAQVAVRLVNMTVIPNEVTLKLVPPPGLNVAPITLMGPNMGGAAEAANIQLIFNETAGQDMDGLTPQLPLPSGDIIFSPVGDTTLLSGKTPANGTWKLTAINNNANAARAGTIANGWELAIATTPVLQPISDVSMPEDQTTLVTVDIGDDVSGVVVTATPAPVLPETPGVIFETPGGTLPVSGSGRFRTITLDPILNATGTNQITVVATLAGFPPSTRTFLAKVTAINDSPVFSPAEFRDVKGFATEIKTVEFEVSDAESPLADIELTATSGNPAVVQNNSQSLYFTQLGTAGGKAQYRLTMVPVGNVSGVCTVVVSASTKNDNDPSDTGRLEVTVDFAAKASGWQPSAIVINDSFQTPTKATPYPSTIKVSGVVGTVTNVVVTLMGFSHSYPDDVDIMLMSPGVDAASRKSVVLMSDVGGSTAVNNLRLTFQNTIIPQTVSTLPNAIGDNGPLVSGYYLPSNEGAGDNFPDAPGSTAQTSLANAFDGMNPNDTWSLYVVDDAPSEAGRINDGWLLAFGTAPVFTSPVPPRLEVAEDSGDTTVPLTVGDSDTPPAAIAVSVLSTSNLDKDNKVVGPANLLEVVTVTQDANNKANWTLKIKPRNNLYGINYVTLQVSDGSDPDSSNTAKIEVVVTPVNDAPAVVITSITQGANTLTLNADGVLVLGEDATATTPIVVTYTVSDVESKIEKAGFAASSGNTTILPDSKISINKDNLPTAGAGASATVPLTFSLAPDQAGGPFNLNVLVSDASDPAAQTIKALPILVTAVNDAPVISEVKPNPAEVTQGGSVVVNFTVTDTESDPKAVEITYTTSDANLIPLSNIVLGGSGTARTVTITPVGVNAGSATVTLTAKDPVTGGPPSAPAPIVVNVLAAPGKTYANTTKIEVPAQGKASPYPSIINVTDLLADSKIAGLDVTLDGLTSTVPDDLDVLVVRYADSGSTTPTASVIVMSDAGGKNAVSGVRLTFSQTAANGLPDEATLTSGKYLPSNYGLGNDTFDAPAPAGPYGSSLNDFNGQGADGSYRLYVTDDSANDASTIQNGWSITIKPTPTINVSNPEQTVQEDVAAAYNVLLGYDGDVTKVGLSVTGNSNPTLVPNANVAFSGAGANRVATVTPAADQFGVVELTLTADIGGATASTKIKLTVSSQVDAPRISRLTPKTTDEGVALSFDFEVVSPEPGVTASDISVSAKVVLPNPNATPNGIDDAGLKIAYLGSSLYRLTMTPFADVPPPQTVNTITITAKDNKSSGTPQSASDFTLTVKAVATPPVVAPISDKSVAAGSSTAPILVKVSDGDSAQVKATATSLNPEIIPNSGISLTPTGLQNVTPTVPAEFNLTVTAPAGVAGKAQISVVAEDVGGAKSAPVTFFVTVVPTREVVFSNSQKITINDNAKSSPYPSTIQVSGLAGSVDTVKATVKGFTHSFPQDVDMLLVGPQQTNVVLMSDAGGSTAVQDLTLVFSQAAANPVPEAGPLTTGTYRPAQYGADETFPDVQPAVVKPYGTTLNLFTNTSPNGTWQLYVLDDTPSDAGAITNGWSLGIITKPLIVGLQDQTTEEDVSNTQSFTVAEEDAWEKTFTMSATSSDQTVVKNGDIVITATGASGTNYTVTATPVANATGQTTISVFAKNKYDQVSGASYKLTVTPVNDPPYITPVADQTLTAGSVAQVTPFDYGDAETPKKDLTFTVTSSDPVLLPPANVSNVGNTLFIVPTGTNVGVATVTITVTEPGGTKPQSATEEFTVTVLPSSTPLFVNSTPIVIPVSGSANPYPSPIVVEGIEGTISQVRVTLLGLNHTYPDDLDIMVSSPDGQKVILMSDAGGEVDAVSLRITFDQNAATPIPDSGPLVSGSYKPANYEGSDNYPNAPAGPTSETLNAFIGKQPNGTWNLYVVDDGAPDSGSIAGGWQLNIITTSPTISAIPNQTTPEDTVLNVPFTVLDGDTAQGSLIVTATSTESKNIGLKVVGTTSDRILEITPALNWFGTATVTVTVSDGTSSDATSFTLTVTPVNDAPLVVGLMDTNTPTNVKLIMPFTVSDADNSLSDITVTATSKNPSLLAAEVNGGAGSYNLVLTPNGVVGTAQVEVVTKDPTTQVVNNLVILITAAQVPTINPIPDNTVAEDGAFTFPITIGNTTSTNVVVTAIAADTNLVKSISVQMNGLTGSGLVVLVPNANGQSQITVSATDQYGTGQTGFLLTVTPVADVPTIAPIPDQTTGENMPVVVALTVTDPDTAAADLKFTGTASNNNLVSGVTFANTSSNTLATVQLKPDATGFSVVTISVGDGTSTASTSFGLQVTNLPPTVSTIADVTTPEDVPVTVSFTVGNAATNVVVLGTASNTNLVSGIAITQVPNTLNYSAVISLVTNVAGTSKVTITATDDTGTGASEFNLTVTVVDDAPTLAQIPDQITGENTQLSIPLVVADPDTAPNELVYSADGYDTNLVSGVTFDTTTTNATAVVNLVQNQTGFTPVTIMVSSVSATSTNSASSTFSLTVTNLPISIAPIAPITVAEDSTVTVPVTVLSTASTNVQVVGTASNSALVSSVSVVGSGVNWIATINLVPNAFGESTITMTAWDEAGTNSTDFLLTVTAVDDVPALGVIPDQTTGENMPIAVVVPVSDPDTAVTNLVFGYETNDTNLVTAVTFEVTETNVTATVVPMADMVGTATVTISAASGTNVSYTSFEATWTNLPPSISHIGNISVLEDSPPVVASFTVINTTSTNVVVTGAASDTNLVESVVIAGGPVNYTATMTLVPNAFGQTFITITATEPVEGSGSTTFLLNVVPVDDAPVLEPIADQTTLENVPVSIPLVITDIDTANSALTFGYSTSDTNLVSNVTFTTTESNVVATVELVANAFGAATVTIDVSDSLTTSSQSFGLTVTKTPPTVSAIPGQSMNEDTVLVVPFTVSNTSSEGLVVAASASDSNLVQSITVSGTLPDYNATITLVPNAWGNSMVTITATDAAGTGSSMFNLVVNAVEDAPTLAQIPDQETTVNVPVTIPLVITDPDTALTNLTYSWTTSNPSLVSNVTFNVTATTAEATVIPALNATGVGAVTIKVSDSAGLAVSAFALTVTEPNQESQLSVTLNGSVLSIGITGAPDTTYTVQGTSDFVTWTDVGTVTTDASGKAVYTTNTTASLHTYYRTKAQ